MQLKDELAPLLIENAPVMIIVLDIQGRILDFNRRMGEVSGYHSEEVCGKNWFDTFLEKSDRARQRELFSQALKGVAVRGGVSMMLGKCGEKRLIAWNDEALRNRGGEIIGLLRIGQDVTESERAQEALRESEERYRLLAESANDFIFIFNEQCDIQYVNAYAVSQFERQRSDMIGRNIRHLLPEDAAAVFSSHIRDAIKTCNSLAVEFEVRLPRAVIWLHTYLVPLKHKDGSVYAALAVCRDLTERRRSERALEEAKKRFESAIENTPLAAIQGFSRDGTVQHWNAVCERIYGFSATEALGQKVQDLILAGGSVKEFEEELERVWTTGKATSPRQWPVKSKDGKERWVYSSMFPVFHEGVVSEVFCMDVDITERILAEDLLKRSEEKYRLVSDFTYDWETWMGPDGTFLYVSPSCERTTGYRADEFIKNSHFILDIVSPDDRQKFAAHFDRSTQESRDVCHMDFKIIRRDGEVRWISHSCQPVYHADGGWFGRRSSNRDITDRKKAEEQTAFLKEQIEFVLGATKINVDIIDPELNLRYVDPAWQKTYGDPAGRKCYEYFMHRDSVCENCGVLRAIEAKTTILTERKLPLEGNRWIQITTKPFQNEKGELLVAETNVDITARKWAEDVLRESEEKYSVLVEKARDGVVIIQDGVYQFANRAFENLLGFSFQEVVGKPVEHLIAPAQKDLVKAYYAARMAGKNPPTRYEVGLARKDGSLCYGEISAALIQYRGRPAVMGVFRDVTERRRFEDELKRAKEEAEEASRAKSRFLAHVSHEIRTPLNAILGFTELLYTAHLNSAERGYLNIIRESGEVLLAVISDILDVSKVEAGEFVLEEIDFGLADLVEGVVEMVRPRLFNKSVSLVWHFEKNMPLYFNGDPTRIRQVFLNLLNNAVKFTEQGEIRLNVSVDSSHSSPAAGTRKILISIKDTGVGIPKEKQAVIFDAFIQSDASITRKYGGTGLGLHITKRLVEIMGGEIKVVSEPGKGSEFVAAIILREGKVPIASQKPVAANDRPESPEISEAGGAKRKEDQEALRGVRVLIAEDNRVNQKLISIVLKNMGCVVDAAFNGVEAIAKVKKNRYDVMILDLQMPLMGGLDVAKTIRKEISQDLPLIALTAHVMKEDEQACYDAGMNDYLAKPVSGEKIKEKILCWVKRR